MGLSRMRALPRNKAGKCVKAKVCANPSPEPSTVQKPYPLVLSLISESDLAPYAAASISANAKERLLRSTGMGSP
jgi:hypothetical protein